jgi:DNA-binding transcriptional regulator LsrR (DeoR family)
MHCDLVGCFSAMCHALASAPAQNLSLNIAEKGFSISVFNRSYEKTEAAVARAQKEGALQLLCCVCCRGMVVGDAHTGASALSRRCGSAVEGGHIPMHAPLSSSKRCIAQELRAEQSGRVGRAGLREAVLEIALGSVFHYCPAGGSTTPRSPCQTRHHVLLPPPNPRPS